MNIDAFLIIGLLLNALVFGMILVELLTASRRPSHRRHHDHLIPNAPRSARQAK